MSEFRLQSGPHRFFDIEQFIERFDVSKIDALMNDEDNDDLPEFLVLHKSLLDEEKQLMHSLYALNEEAPKIDVDANNNELETDSFQLMNRLFFSDNQTVLSAGSTFDPQLT